MIVSLTLFLVSIYSERREARPNSKCFSSSTFGVSICLALLVRLLLLVDPLEAVELPGLELLVLEPQSDLLIGAINGVGAVADVSANVLCNRLAYAVIFMHP